MTTSITLTNSNELSQSADNTINSNKFSELVANGFVIPKGVFSKCDGFYSSVNLISFIKKTFNFLTNDHRLTVTSIDISRKYHVTNPSFLEISNPTTGDSYNYVLLGDLVNCEGRIKMHRLDA